MLNTRMDQNMTAIQVYDMTALDYEIIDDSVKNKSLIEMAKQNVGEGLFCLLYFYSFFFSRKCSSCN